MPRQTGMLHPTDGIPLIPDTVSVFNMTGGSSAQAADWLSSGSTVAANAATAGVHIVRITGRSSGGVPFPFSANFASTKASSPTSGTSVSSGAGVNIPMEGLSRFFQIPGDSTGYSVFSESSGSIIIEQWRK